LGQLGQLDQLDIFLGQLGQLDQLDIEAQRFYVNFLTIRKNFISK